MPKAKVDQCLFTRHDAEGHFQSLIFLQVDDTLAVVLKSSWRWKNERIKHSSINEEHS